MSVRLEMRELEVGYHGRSLLPALTTEVCAAEQWAIIGPNGSGKSTLLRTVLGLQRATGGGSTLHGRVGYVPQRTSVNRNLPARVIDMVRSGVDVGWSFLSPTYVRRHAEVVERAMRDTDTVSLAKQQFQSLSEGQKQRVMVARALACDPQILVLDEPSAAMDIAAERSLFDLLAALRESRDIAVLIVSHHLSVATSYATHAILVDKDRKVAVAGSMDEVARSAEARERYGDMLFGGG